MPLYEYQCQKCGHRFERIQRFSDAMVKKCPECGGKVEQLISAPAVQFKGTGWYVTDYARKGSSKSSGDGGEGSDSGVKVEAKAGDSKAESKEHKPKHDASHDHKKGAK